MNEQIDPLKIAWLAGLIDGEGTMGFYVSSPRSKGTRETQKNLSIINGDLNILDEASRILASIVGHPVRMTQDYRKNRPNVYYSIRIHARDDIIRALSILEPYLVGKKAQARLLLQMLSAHRKWTKYTDEEKKCVDRLKQLKSIGYLKRSEVDNAELSGTITEVPKRVEAIYLASQKLIDLDFLRQCKFWDDDIAQTPAKAEDESASAS